MVEKVYLSNPTKIAILDHERKRTFVLRKDGFPDAENAMAELGRLLMYKASRDWLPTVSGEIQTPMEVAKVEFIDPREPPLAVVPILRAGLALAEHAPSILPATKTYHLGSTLEYWNCVMLYIHIRLHLLVQVAL